MFLACGVITVVTLPVIIGAHLIIWVMAAEKIRNCIRGRTTTPREAALLEVARTIRKQAGAEHCLCLRRLLGRKLESRDLLE